MPPLSRLTTSVALSVGLIASPLSAQRVAVAAVSSSPLHAMPALPRDTAAHAPSTGRRIAWTSLGAFAGLILADRAVGTYRNSQQADCSYCGRSYRNEAY